ncbi:MAG TPA: MFS transporter [Gemmatimonadales bacterium]|nr:MFS transporter [Gemmatimonadales bacterium]
MNTRAGFLPSDLQKLTVLIAVCFVDMIGLLMIAPLLTFYALRLGGQASTVGPLFSSFAVAQLLASPIWGRVSDRYGRRPVLIIGLLASAIAYLIFGFANSLWLLFVCRIVQGFGGGTTGVAQAYVADAMEPSRRAKALGWLSAATSLGVSIGAVLGSLTHRLWGPRGPGISAAVLVLVNMLIAWKWLPESRVLTRPPEETRHTVDPDAPSGWRRAVNNIARPVWNVVRHPGRPVSEVIWVYAIGMLALNSLIAVLSLYLQQRFGMNENNVGPIYFVFSGVGVVMRTYPVGWINERLGEVRTMRLGAILLGTGLLLMPLPRTEWAFICCLILSPIGTALLFPASTALVSHRTNRNEYGVQMGAQQTLRGIMSIVGPIGATLAFQYLGPGVPFLIAAGIVALAALLAFRVKDTAAHEPAPIAA